MVGVDHHTIFMAMNRRINIILSDETILILILDRLAPKGDRSRFISDAVRHYVQDRGRQRLREQLRAGYKANSDENLKMAAEWFPLEEDAWRKSERSKRGRK